MRIKPYILGLSLLALLIGVSPAYAFGNGYSYSRSITIDHTKVGSTDSSNFTVLVSGTYSYLATVANGGLVQNANGYDVGFFSDSSCATKLNWETETYSATTGAVNYWVKVPTLSHTADTVFYLCYGNSSISTDQSNATGAWDASTQDVYHFPNGSTLSVNDSTGAHNLTNGGATATTGKIDGAAAYTGTQNMTTTGYYPLTTTGAFTTSAWVKTTDTASDAIMTWGTGSTAGSAWDFQLENGVIAGRFYGGEYVTAGTGYNNGAWRYVVLVKPSGGTPANVLVYGDGSSLMTTHGGTTAIAPGASNSLGVGYNSVQADNYLQGSLDEVRLDATDRSADWILASYNNQSSPSTFYTVGAASSAGVSLKIMSGILRIASGKLTVAN